MTDNQIVNETFLVYINDLLSTGYIPDLCTPASSFSALHRWHASQELAMMPYEECQIKAIAFKLEFSF